jgi:hypothetical protein
LIAIGKEVDTEKAFSKREGERERPFGILFVTLAVLAGLTQ